jgi:hypothetical protein
VGFIFTILAAIFCPPLLPLGIAMDVSGAINIANHWESISNSGSLGLGIARAVGFYSVGGGQMALTYFGGPLGSVVGSYVGEMSNSLIAHGDLAEFGNNIGSITQGAILSSLFAPVGSSVGGSITKGIGNKAIQTIAKNLIASNISSFLTSVSSSVWSGDGSLFDRVRNGVSDYTGAGKKWY